MVPPEIAAIDGNVMKDAPPSYLYMRGKYILDAVYDSLLEEYEMTKARRLVMAGSSAGGLAIYLQVVFDIVISQMI